MVKGLEERLQKEPNNPDGWYMLARSYNTMKRYDKAVQALEQLNKLVPNNADLLADYADTLAMTQNQSLQGAPEKLINQAIALDPKNVKALSLSGSAAFERREYRQAIAQWKRVLPLLASDTEMTKITLSNIGEAQSLLGETPDTGAALGVLQAATPESVVANPAPAVDSTSRLTGVVEIDASMRSKVGDDDAVFIFARAAQGARMPLVVLRKQVKDLPYKFTLDDSMSIAPDTHLKNHAALVVGARVSKNGNATPVSGDPEGLSTPVAPGASGIVINISSEHK
jgi:cytochrome c-type biogenesis protein CcmH